MARQPFTPRRLRVALGSLWVIDGLLQLQPYMFTKAFLTYTVEANAMGLPASLQEPIGAAIRLVQPHLVAYDLAFAFVQLSIGAAIIAKRTARAGLAASIAWGMAVWYLGEGLGGITGGFASMVAGAPGAALLYVLLAVVLWPKAQHPAPESPAAAAGLLGETATRWAWALLWLSGAYFEVQPTHAPSLIMAANFQMVASGEPRLLSQLDSSLAAFAYAHGNPIALVLAIAMVLVGTGVLRHGWGAGRLEARAAKAGPLEAGIALSVAFWVFGQNFGGILTGSGTDLNSGPVLVLLALTLYRPALYRPAPRSPGSAGAAGHPVDVRLPAREAELDVHPVGGVTRWA